MRSLHAVNFYGDTIALEHEKGFDLVGVSLWAEGLHMKGIYIVHGFEHLSIHAHHLTLPRRWHWKYRKSSSAGSSSNHAQGLITRAHLALRLSFPLDQARRSMARLIAIALAVGIETSSIANILKVLSCRYRHALHHEFVSAVVSALAHKDVWVIYQMGV